MPKNKHKLDYSLDRVPKDELEIAAQQALERSELYESRWHVAAYEDAGLTVIADPFDQRLVGWTCQAVEQGAPLSVIRLGEGEMSLMTFGFYDQTPNLDRFAAVKSIYRQSDSFRVFGDDWLFAIRETFLASVAWADIVGVSGLWAAEGPAKTFRSGADGFRAAYVSAPKGLHGDFRARTYLPYLAKNGHLGKAKVASNHLYLAYLDGFQRLMQSADSILLVSNKVDVLQSLKRMHPDKRIAMVEVGDKRDPRRMKLRSPFFLSEKAKEMPRDLSGTLCLVAAGPWSLVYCRWIKERGGVAVDLGSGIDLLGGRTTRTVHKQIQHRIESYRIVTPNDPSSTDTAVVEVTNP